MIIIRFLIKFVPESKTDVISVNNTGTGNLFPEEGCTLMTTNANVIFDINYLESSNKIDISFKGNYTIYKPNESRNIMITAPFSPQIKNLEATCLIKVENKVAPFSFIQHHWSDPWDQYLDSVGLGMSDRKNFILTNITFPENISDTIEYTFDVYINQSDSDGKLFIYYDVGTSRGWNGIITECVEFKVNGKLPDSYSKNIPDKYNYCCTISNFSYDRNYVWEVVDETIMINSVYISYSYPGVYFWGRIAPFIIFGCFLGVPVIIGVVIKLRYREGKGLELI
jgi:hypothetical protein